MEVLMKNSTKIDEYSDKNIWFDVEVKPNKSREIYKTIAEMNGVVDISEYLRG